MSACRPAALACRSLGAPAASAATAGAVVTRPPGLPPPCASLHGAARRPPGIWASAATLRRRGQRRLARGHTARLRADGPRGLVLLDDVLEELPVPASEIRFWEIRLDEPYDLQDDAWSDASLEAALHAAEAVSFLARSVLRQTEAAAASAAPRTSVDPGSATPAAPVVKAAVASAGEAANSFCSMAWIRQELADLRSDVSSLVTAVHGLDHTEKPGCKGVDLAEKADSLFSTAWARQESADLHSDVSSLTAVVHGLGHRLDHAVPSSLLRAWRHRYGII